MSDTCTLFPVWRPLAFLPVTLSTPRHTHQAQGGRDRQCFAIVTKIALKCQPLERVSWASFENCCTCQDLSRSLRLEGLHLLSLA